MVRISQVGYHVACPKWEGEVGEGFILGRHAVESICMKGFWSTVSTSGGGSVCNGRPLVTSHVLSWWDRQTLASQISAGIVSAVVSVSILRQHRGGYIYRAGWYFYLAWRFIC